jgi:hypothetical protein
MRLVICLILAFVLAGCTSRAFYEDLREENARRQYEPGRDIVRDPPPPSYDAYEKERQRLKEEPRK